MQLTHIAVWLLCLCASTVPVVQAARPVQDLAKPDYKVYHTKDQLFQQVHQIVAANLEIMKVEEVAAPQTEYSSPLTVVTVEPGGLTTDHSQKIRLLLNFGQHGRELISSEVALRLLRLLADPGAAARALEQHGRQPSLALDLLSRTVFKVLPMENVHGRELVEGGKLCERRNGRGVDTNRNWDLHWGFREKDYDPAEEYPGAAPFSEPEASALLALARDFQPHVWVNVHSGMEALFLPYDHVAHIPEGEPAQAALRILQELNQAVCGGRCAVGSGGQAVGYLAHGTATDYMYQTLGVPLAFTWEIYGDTKAHYLDCFRMFNPLTAEGVEAVVAAWAAAFLVMLELLPSHPALSLPPAPHLRAHSRKGAGLPEAAQVANTLATAQQAALQAFSDDLRTAEAHHGALQQAHTPLHSAVVTYWPMLVLLVVCAGMVVLRLISPHSLKLLRRRLKLDHKQKVQTLTAL